jgi:hypothetical protein
MCEYLSPNSFYKPYIDILPSEFGIPLYFTLEEFAALRGSPLQSQAILMLRAHTVRYMELRAIIELDTERVQSVLPLDKFTYQLYRWAVAVVKTRQNEIPACSPDEPAAPATEVTEATASAEASSGSSRTALSLIPMWDMCNHSTTGGQITTFFNAQLLELEFSAMTGFQEGEQIRMCYGPRPNTELLMYSGFIQEEPANEYDVLHIWMALPAVDGEQQQQQQLVLYKRQVLFALGFKTRNGRQGDSSKGSTGTTKPTMVMEVELPLPMASAGAPSERFVCGLRMAGMDMAEALAVGAAIGVELLQEPTPPPPVPINAAINAVPAVAGADEGDWVRGKRTGNGKHTNKNGSSYEGAFVEGKAHGRGVKTWANGQCYTGQWESNKQHGEGVLTLADGTKQQGKFEHNKFVGDATKDATKAAAKAAAKDGTKDGTKAGTKAAPDRVHPLADMLGGFSRRSLRKQETIVTKRDGSKYVESLGADGQQKLDFITAGRAPSYLHGGAEPGAESSMGAAGAAARIAKCIGCVGSPASDARARTALVAACKAWLVQFPSAVTESGSESGTAAGSAMERTCHRYCEMERRALISTVEWAQLNQGAA